MTPLTLLATQKFAGRLTNGNSLSQMVASLAASAQANVPAINKEQIVLTPAPAEMADRNMQLGYPRVCVYSNAAKNAQTEKFRSFSGTVTVSAEIWASGDLLTDVDQWIHFYVEGVTQVLRSNVGDWGDGMFYSGVYDLQFQPPKAGGLGFVESAKVSFTLQVSQNQERA
jgi:hypothetical protein